MTFASAGFAIFVLAGLIIYYAVPDRQKWPVLLFLSYTFYLSRGLAVGGYILFTTLTTYFCGVLIGNVNKSEASGKDKKRCKRKKRIYAAVALLLNFGLLFFVKYWNFTLDLLRVPENILRVDILLPLGISFYIFQSMGYIIDLVRNKYKPQRSLLKFALFVSFFPQLVQGPIGRYDVLKPQLYTGHKFSTDNIRDGAKLVLWGYIKKLVIADRASVIACAVIDHYTDYSGSMILFGVIFYCIQLYGDFSGGIDVARGIAKLFGIDLAENFKRPFFATSLADFWRRWHITLGAWLKDYLFYPLTLSKPFIFLGKFARKHIKGKAGKILPTSLATFMVYFVIGIWHGASWKYILFGCWNGVIITASLLLEPSFTAVKKKLSVRDGAVWYKAVCILRTTVIVLIGRYITRAANIGTALSMLSKTFRGFSAADIFNGTIMNLGLTASDYAVVAIGVLLIFIFELCEECGFKVSEKIEQKGSIPTFVFILAGVLILIIFGIYRDSYIASEFIYRQF